MSRIYAVVEGTEERVLVRLECDGCDATLKPGPHVLDSGWMKTGWADACGGEAHEQEWCPSCWWKRPSGWLNAI